MSEFTPDSTESPSEAVASGPHGAPPGSAAEAAVPTPRPTRRGLLGALGAGLAGAAIGGAGAASVVAASFSTNDARTGAHSGIVPFHGTHQAGIITPAQDRLHFAAFTMLPGAGREGLIQLLTDWTVAARALTAGREIGDGAAPKNPLLPPDDTGEAQGLGAGHLTITFGLGRELFAPSDESAAGADPYGIRHRLPSEFEPLPSFAFDLLDATQSGGDLCVQACADDPQIAVHAIRNLSRIAAGRAHLTWSQLGFGRTSSTSREQDTPRNLFGFKDGTANVMAQDTKSLTSDIWVGENAPEWLRGGSYLVARKIQMTIETWDRASLGEQERIIGRTKVEGGPLSGGTEFSEPNFAAKQGGEAKIDIDAHVRLAHPTHNGGVQLLRRGYNYVDGSNGLGQLGAGLFFISFQKSPESFVTVQRSLKPDLLNEYIRHIASGLWAIPGGISDGEFVAQALFD